MIFIVLYHCVCYYGIWKIFPEHQSYDNIELWRAACNVALNTFVVISGFLFGYLYIEKVKYRDKKSFVINKIKRLLVPYFFWGIIAWCLFPNVQPFIDIFYGMQHLWFLLMLFDIFVISIFMIDKFLNWSLFTQCSVFFVVLSVNMILQKFDILYVDNYFGILTAIKYLPAFMVGIMIAQHKWGEQISQWNDLRIVSFLGLSICAVIFMAVMKVLPFGLMYINIPTFVFIVFLYGFLSKHYHGNLPSVIQNLDSCSLGIYIIHHLLIWGILFYIPNILELMNEHFILAPIILFIGILATSWLLTNLFKRNNYTAHLVGN